LSNKMHCKLEPCKPTYVHIHDLGEEWKLQPFVQLAQYVQLLTRFHHIQKNPTTRFFGWCTGGWLCCSSPLSGNKIYMGWWSYYACNMKEDNICMWDD
jgi:hypothetical protein